MKTLKVKQAKVRADNISLMIPCSGSFSKPPQLGQGRGRARESVASFGVVPRSRAHAFTEVHMADGTYEFCGPHFSANPEKTPYDLFLRHGNFEVPLGDRTFDGLQAFLRDHPMEGIVFDHPDGRMVKIRRHDFSLAWPA